MELRCSHYIAVLALTSLAPSVGYLIPPHPTSTTPLHYSKLARADTNPVYPAFGKALTILQNPEYSRLYHRTTDIGVKSNNYKASTHSEHQHINNLPKTTSTHRPKRSNTPQTASIHHSQKCPSQSSPTPT